MAQEEAQGKLYDYLYAKYTMKSLFGITMTDDDFIEDSYMVYRNLGNVATANHSYNAKVSEDCQIQLPCNCEYIDSVSEGRLSPDDDDIAIVYSDSKDVTVTTGYNFLPDVINDQQYKRHNLSKSQLKPTGSFIPYEIDRSCNDKLLFDKKFIGEDVNVIYRGILMDNDKNPLLSIKEVEAIAYKMAFIKVQKKAFMGDTAAGGMLQYMKIESERKTVAAKIPEYITQNFIDRLLTAKTRHDRKVYYSSYKTME